MSKPPEPARDVFSISLLHHLLTKEVFVNNKLYWKQHGMPHLDARQETWSHRIQVLPGSQQSHNQKVQPHNTRAFATTREAANTFSTAQHDII